jgi:hypothetical protein
MYLARVGARNSYVVLKEILNEYYKNHLSEFDNRAIERKNKIEYNVNTLINVENEKVQLAKLACQ